MQISLSLSLSLSLSIYIYIYVYIYMYMCVRFNSALCSERERGIPLSVVGRRRI